MYVNVIINILNKNVDALYTYKVDHLPDFLNTIDDALGYRVIVPFGGGNKNKTGYILSTSTTCEYPIEKIKSIISFPDIKKTFSKVQIDLAIWMREKYFCTTYSCLKLMLSSGNNITSSQIYQLNIFDYKLDFLENEKKIISYIEKYQSVYEKELIEEFGSSVKTTLKKLVKKNILKSLQLSKVKDLTIRIKQVSINYDKYNIEKLLVDIKQLDNKQSLVIDFLEQNETLPFLDIIEALGISASPIETLAKKGILKIEKEEIRRNSIFDIENKNATTYNLDLTLEQENALNTIILENSTDTKKPILLHGVTGSGKTEIYLQIIQKILDDGKEAIVLVPEISLTTQVVNIFLSRFGKKVSVTHSRLSLGERHDQLKKARDGEISIMIGPRSALFTPFSNLGIIIIDEEHENTYKSDTTPKYDAIEVAQKLSTLSNSLLILGSATPKLGTYTKALNNDFTLIKMKDRVNNCFPSVFINDMRVEILSGNRSIFSRSLQEAMVETLNADKQIILFLNRRGFSNFVSCRDCGYVVTCENCNVNYTYHKYSNKLICHYCNSELKNPENCPICGSRHIRHFGVGTQRIEDDIKALFPKENVLRMDFDTTSKKNSHEKILEEFRCKKSRILIGTQMIAKGLDFPDVTLVGIISADLSLHAGDFQSSENTFQLITQVSGRAGRGSSKGNVIIQTYTPEHYSIVHAKNNDYESFYNEEIAVRRQMHYPPFTNIFTIMFTGIDEKRVIIVLHRLLDIMNFYNKKGFFTMIGPSQAIISKIKNKYRWKIIVKGDDYDLLVKFNLFCLDKLKKVDVLSDIDVNVNINPSVIL